MNLLIIFLSFGTTMILLGLVSLNAAQSGLDVKMGFLYIAGGFLAVAVTAPQMF